MAFAGIQNGKPEVRIIQFYNSNSGSEQVNINFSTSSVQIFTVLGTKTFYTNITSQRKFGFIRGSKNNPVEVISEIIENQATLTPDYVSLPIDVLQISARGHVWIARKAECEDQV